jgi:hypothetical protein
MNPLIQSRKTTILALLIASMFGYFELLPRTQGAPPVIRASCNTAEGLQALENITTGVANTAFGCQALFSEMTGSRNTATGSQALFSNIDGINNTGIGNLALENNPW